METIHDFDAWLDLEQPEGHEEIYDLYRSVQLRKTGGFYHVSTKGEQTFIRGQSSTLRLANEKARHAFLAKVVALKDDDQMSMEGWYEFRRSMAKDD
jgi:hypothetical protein